jgi:acetate kinase
VQVACFDTAFHRGHPWVNDTFALPRRFYDAGVRRYGFHGLSYDYITGGSAPDHPDLAQGRVIVAHLGNGASLCAIAGGRSSARPWASRRSTGCRWAPAAASSTPASCST